MHASVAFQEAEQLKKWTGPATPETPSWNHAWEASLTYSTCGYRTESGATLGWLNSAVFLIPARCITAWEGRFTQTVKEYTRSRPNLAKPCSKQALAPSVA